MIYLFCQVLTKKLKILFWQIGDMSFYCNCDPVRLDTDEIGFTRKEGFGETDIVYAVCVTSKYITKL